MHNLNLNGRWGLTWCEPGEGEARGWATGGLPPERRVEARVPGDVHLDLLEAGIIDEPLWGRNAEDCLWMEGKDWWYSRRFQLAPGHLLDRVELHFAGLDCTADVWLNGQPVGHSNNALVGHSFDVTEAAAAGGNLLIVRIDAGLRAAAHRNVEDYSMSSAGDELPRMWIRKPQFTFRWDWAPRLLTCGVWRDVTLCCYRRAALRDLCLATRLRADGSARLEVLAEVENFGESDVPLRLELALERDETHSLAVEGEVAAGCHTLRGEMVIPEPDLWWPAPLGEPALYDVSAELRSGGERLDGAAFRCGLREVELLQEPLGEEGTSFVVAVNGRKVFCKGANWVPADSIIARVSPSRYGALLSAAREANFNMLRVWGGGVYEDDLFYRLCDERGVLVWQDFAFACAYYPDRDEEFMAEVRAEAEKAVRRLRNHPCIALWCGNNENQWIHYQRQGEGKAAERCHGIQIYDELLPEVLGRLDPTRPYRPSSPYGGEDPNTQLEGNRHAWDVSILAPTVAERVDYSRYAEDRGKFITEYGVLSPPPADSLRRYLPCDQMERGSPAWEFHNNRFEKGTNQEALKRYWRPAEKLSLHDYLRFSQAVQAEALKFSLEHWRRRKFRTAGALFWMFSDCWGEVGWSVVDYYLNRKPAFYAVRRAFAPVLVSLAAGEQDVEVWLVNDRLKAVEAELTCGWVDLRTGEVRSEKVPAQAPPNAALCARRLEVPSGRRERWVAFARLERDGQVLSRNRLFLTGFYFNRLPLPAASVRCEPGPDGEGVTVRTDAFAWGVHLDAPAGVRLEDNDFHLLPGQVRGIPAAGPPDLLERVTARPLNDATQRPRS